jgi:omega-hydroxy-beta-dihydromenaquinone-9 sulfotransferase
MTLIQLQPLAGCSSRVFLKLLLDNGGVDFEYIPRALLISLLSAMGGGIRAAERKWYKQKIEPLPLADDPIFVIGHWRSGTTFLHNLISQDEHLGYISNYQAWLPEQSLKIRPIPRQLFKLSLPTKRPMDNVALTLDSPQEEEYSLGNLGMFGFYQGWSFPRKLSTYFDRHVLFEGVTPDYIEQWKKAYLKIVKLASYKNQGKRLILKNPANTARIKVLLELFPNAKFIHIYRNPYTVYQSTQNFYRKLLPTYTFQSFSEPEMGDNVLVFYQKLMQRFFETQSLIPQENLIEIKYEDLETNPMGEVAKIYSQFGLAFEPMKPRLEDYLAAQPCYSKNQYGFEPEVVEKVARYCQVAIERWGYEAPTLSQKQVSTTASSNALK